MTQLLHRLHRLHRREDAQDAFEYLLIIGGVSVALILAITLALPGLLTTIDTWIRAGVDSLA